MRLTLTALSLALFLGNIGTNSAHAHSLSTTQVSVLKHNYLVSVHTVRWYNNQGRWTLHPNFNKCSDVPSSTQEHICRKARHLLQAHALRRDRIWNLLHPPVIDWLSQDLACIHRYEGSWNDNTGNGYYGGLQMDLQFQRLYGSQYLTRYGTADQWPAQIQIKVAKIAYHSGRGFYPWPNSARACGLI